MERTQEVELGQGGLPQQRGPEGRRLQVVGAFAGSWLFFVGAAVVLIGLLWLSERNERRRVEERLVEALRATALGRDEIAQRDEDLARRVARVRTLERDLAKQETLLVRTEEARRKLVDLVGTLAEESNEQRSESEDDAAGGDTDLATIKAHIELVQRINHALRRYGRAELRVHGVDAIENGALVGMRLLRLDADGIALGLYRAATARIDVDCTEGVATIVLREVHETIGGVQKPTQDEVRIRFELEEPRAFVAELSDLVALSGEWPEVTPLVKTTPESLLQRRMWQERFDAFLEGIDGDRKYRLQSVGSIEMPALRDVEILGSNARGIWEQRIRAARVEVRVDESTGRVELLLRDGFIDSREGTIRLPKERDYRMHLPGADVANAKRALMGMVRSDG
ncbi:MAG: hypothetical protein H6834_07660 [Planctomycetes bacterium]|nr:hypothetical protein [Planctomycetota bacterium]